MPGTTASDLAFAAAHDAQRAGRSIAQLEERVRVLEETVSMLIKAVQRLTPIDNAGRR